MACKLYLNKAVLKKESEWKRGLTYWPYSFYKTPHSINYYFHKELSAPYYFSSAMDFSIDLPIFSLIHYPIF